MICFVPPLSIAGMPGRVIPSPWKPRVVVRLSQVVPVAVIWHLLMAGLDTVLISWVSVFLSSRYILHLLRAYIGQFNDHFLSQCSIFQGVRELLLRISMRLHSGVNYLYCLSTEESLTLSQENQATRGKMEQLRLIMEERRARRRARREARSAPYTVTQWSAKSESLSTQNNPAGGRTHGDEPMDTAGSAATGEQHVCELNPPEPVVA